MAEISDREKALLGYSPNSSSNGQSRSSDVDFSDVFGGPPRRSSAQSIDLLSDDHNVEAEESRGSWFGSREKPVFGDQVGVRRRHQYDEFFDDIFRGDQPSLSGSQSPRVVPRRNPFSSAPGSRAMSPSRPLPPTAEPFASPAKFSLPSRMTNTDFMASMSANQSSSRPSLFRFNQSIQNHDYVCGDARSSYRPTALSRQVSVEAKESTSGTKIDGIADGPNIENNAETSGFPNDNASFHFSIYKWASKGVPIEISYRKRSPRSKDATKLDRYWSEIGDGVVTDILVSVNHKVDISENSPSFNKSGMPLRAQEINCDSCNDTNVTSKTEEYKSKDDTFQAKSEPTSYISPLNDVTSYGLEDAKEAQNFSKSSLTFDNSPKSCSEMNRSNMRLLGSFIEDEKTGNKTVKERMVKEKENPSPDDVIPGHTVNKIKLHGPSKEPKKDLRKSKTTSKVKEFVKIFNQESPSKAPKNFLGQSHSSRWEHGNIFVADHEVKSFSTRMHDEMPASYVNWEETWPETSKVVEENYSIPGKQQAGINGSGSAPNAATPTSAEPKSDGLNGSAPRNNATSNSGILYEDTLQDINIQSEIQSQEATESYESKVLQWSKGKEGNIRALLSTLQYVLWPNSGWKPTPLVDIIEANAVKRAYQKAMLCLHPDKLQQKGATMHQKFIAEKVFDTLQEAWDHFNSLGHL